MSSIGEAVPRLRLTAALCEGLHWDHRFGVLWGVDIHGGMVWRWDLASPKWEHWKVGQRVGWVIPVVEQDRVLLGLQEGFAMAPRDTPERFQLLCKPFSHRPELRLNDAKADSSGAVWAGSLNNDDESRADGCLYRLDTKGGLRLVDDGYTVANGPAIRQDGKLLLHTDSGRRTIYAFTLDVRAGTLSGRRVWRSFSEAEGYPDGMCFDAQGCVWVAHWGAGCVCRYTEDGRLLRRIAIPAMHVTNLCFAGPDLDRLFVSTARAGLTSRQLAEQPLAGSLFEILEPGVTGLRSLESGPFEHET
jgi:xylono-1,5-lactonase